jgi:hypothetical protein
METNCVPVAANTIPRSKGTRRQAKLDHRTHATKFLTALIASVEQELGGRERLGILERNCVEGYCGTVLLVQNLNARLARGESIDISAHTRACDVMLRIASHLGLKQHNTGDTHERSAIHPQTD